MELSANEQSRFMQQFQDPNLTMKDLERVWGHPSGTLYRWGFELNVHRPKRKGEVQILLEQARQFCEQISKELPPYDLILPPSQPETGVGPGMDLILFLTDLHFGRLTNSFNAEVANNRMYALTIRLGNLTATLRNKYAVRRLHVFGLGDFVVGENIGRNINLEELEDTVLSQVYSLAVPQLVILTDRLRGIFPKVEVHCVRGNHGLLSKFGPSKSANWDTVAYYAWEARMGSAARKSLRFEIESIHWYKFAKVRSMNWLLVHGDQFPAGSGSPYNGIKAKLDRWHSSMPKPFVAVACGHFHQFAKVGEAWVGPTLLSDDDWSREVIGREGDCGQLVLGVTDQGIEGAWPIWLNDIGQPKE